MKNFVVFLVISFLFVSMGNAQVPDLKNMTLNFEDVTATNINMVFVESVNGNEKTMDFADYDADGDLDMVIAIADGDFGQRRNKLYRNDGGILNEVSGTDVIPEFEIDDNAKTALFKDFDNDGWPDIIVACDSNSGTATSISPGTTKYYRNVDGDHFVNETFRLNGFNGGVSFAAAADFDKNGFLDLVLCNHPNQNQDRISFNAINSNGAGEFQDLTSTHLPIDAEYGKHVETADMNGDGKIDILMASHAADDSFIYYNNNNNAGSGDGDFRYSGVGAEYEFDSAGGGIMERAIVPVDFNNDGLMDLYVANAGGFDGVLSDAIFVNVGNDANNRAMFETQGTLPGLGNETMKATIADLDGDGRDDVIVMAENRRPYILRNTSENGSVSFVEWTHPLLTATTHEGFEAAARQLTGTERMDLFVGAIQGDYLFEGTASTITNIEGDTTVLPEFHGEDPIALTGMVGVSGEKTLVAVDLPAGANVSVLMRSFGDLSVTAELNGIELSSSNNSGHGTDEFMQFLVPEAGNVVFTVSADAISMDGNGDDIVNLLDVGSFINCLTGASTDCDAFDLNDNGIINLTFVDPFIEAITELRTEDEFVIEFLSRND